MKDNPNCYKCKYYAVTWNPKTPNTCKFFGFQSAQLPSVVVYNSTREMCAAFELKENKQTPGSSQ